MLDDESAVVDRLGDDGLRELAVDELGEEPLRRTLVDAEAHSRRAVAQVGDQRGHQPTTRGADHTEARVARVEPLQQREVGAHRLELAVDPTRAVEHEDAELGGLGPLAAAHEQRHAELRFELAHLVGDVRLDGRERIGGGRERPFLGDGEQRVEMPELHGTLLTPIVESDGYHRV